MNVRSPVPVMEYAGGAFRPATAEAVREISLRLTVNGRESSRLVCSGFQPEFLAAGRLLDQGLIHAPSDVLGLETIRTKEGFEVRVVVRPDAPREPPPPLAPSAPDVAPRPEDLLRLARELQAGLGPARSIRGLHAAALCSARDVLFSCCDIGRHNAVDAVLGRRLLEGPFPEAPLLLTTGRVASDIVRKVLRAGLPFLACLSVPTDLAVKRAEKGGLTLAGDIGPSRFLVYNDPAHLLTRNA